MMSENCYQSKWGTKVRYWPQLLWMNTWRSARNRPIFDKLFIRTVAVVEESAQLRSSQMKSATHGYQKAKTFTILCQWRDGGRGGSGGGCSHMVPDCVAHGAAAVLKGARVHANMAQWEAVSIDTFVLMLLLLLLLAQRPNSSTPFLVGAAVSGRAHLWSVRKHCHIWWCANLSRTAHQQSSFIRC